MNRLLKRCVAVFLCVIMAGTGFHVSSYGEVSGMNAVTTWDGTTITEPVSEKGVYLIEDAAQLAWLSNYVNQGNATVHAKLTSDIDLGGHPWTPIGNSKTKYTGCFDGNGYAIRNLFIDTDTNYIGLFGYLGGGSEITDFYLDGTVTSSYESNGGFAGGVAGYASGSTSQPVCVTNVRNSCEMDVRGSSYGSYAGGIVGYCGTNVVIEQCSNSANIAGTQKAVGGIAGMGRRISDCVNTGYVSGGVSVGGIAGVCSTDEITNCYNTGYVKGSNYVGGITALTSKTVVKISNCYDTGKVEAYAADGIQDALVAAPLAKTDNCYYVDPEKNSYYKYGQRVTEEEIRSTADELGDSFAVNVHSEYHFGYPLLTWELEEADFSGLEKKEITAVTIAEGKPSDVSVQYGTGMSEKMYRILGLPEEVILNIGREQIRVPASWNHEGYYAETAGVYNLTPVYEMPAKAVLSEEAAEAVIRVTVREKGEAAPLISSVRLPDDTADEVTVKYGRTSLGLPEHVLAVVDGVEKEVYAEWMLPDNFDTTLPGTYEARAYFPEEYRLTEEVRMPVMTVHVKEQGYLAGLKFSSIKNDSYYEMTPAFDETIHEYTVLVPDSKSTFYCETALDESAGKGSIEAVYRSTGGKETTKEITSGEILNLPQVVRAGNSANTANDNTVTLRVKDEKGQLQTYVIHVNRIRSLKSLKVLQNGTELILKPGFSNQVYDYTVQIPDAVDKVNLQAEATAADSILTVTSDKADSQVSVQKDGTYDISLGKDILTTVTVRVAGETERGAGAYAIHLKKLRTAVVEFQVSPQAVVLVKDSHQERIWEEEDGTFHLLEGEPYTYSVSREGYCSVKETFTAETGIKKISMVPAKENSDIPVDITAQWPSFAKNAANNAVIENRTPVCASEAALYWATQLGEGYGGQATGAPLLVDGYMIVTAKDRIYKLDRFTGKVLAENQMSGASSFSIVPPTYADGMIFVGLANGTIQAFRADNLESLWIFRDELKGQPNSPIKYHNGYLYTGFWNSETKQANFVCVSATDEDSSRINEDKVSVWTHTQPGGFYWAGAYVCDRYILVGTDDGAEGYETQSSEILSLDVKTGKVIDRISGLNGDIRSSISYDEETNRYYVTSKGGSFYGFTMNDDGTFVRNEQGVKGYDLKEISLGGMSTSTPVVYHERAYVGVAGTSQFTADSGHGIVVLDLTTWEIAYKAETKGYPQTSGLLTTAYEEEDGYVYVYFVDNYTPGEVRYLKDKAGVTEVLEPYVESVGNVTKTYAPVLFTPSGAQAQYAICTPVADEYGTLYFKNDSAYLMAVGSNIERIEVTVQPDKTVYEPGEDFDAGGMEVQAVLCNGMTRDITDYTEIVAGENLTMGRREVSIRYGDVLYHDTDETDGAGCIHKTHVKLYPLYTSVRVSVGEEGVVQSPAPIESASPTESMGPEESAMPSQTPLPSNSTEPNASFAPGTEKQQMPGDVTGDGKVTLEDARSVLKAALKIASLEEDVLLAADVNVDRRITLEDARLILKVALKIIKQFPTT